MPAPSTYLVPDAEITAPSDGRAAHRVDRQELVVTGGTLTVEHRDHRSLWELATDHSPAGAAAAAELVGRALERAVLEGDDQALVALDATSSTWSALERLRAHLGVEIESLDVRRAGASVMVDLVLRRVDDSAAPPPAGQVGEDAAGRR